MKHKILHASGPMTQLYNTKADAENAIDEFVAEDVYNYDMYSPYRYGDDSFFRNLYEIMEVGEQ